MTNPLAKKLRLAKLRPTRQRLALANLLFSGAHKHVTAEDLFEQAKQAEVPVSLATVYNTLHQFTEAGLLVQIAVDGSRSYFDTNTTHHHHFYKQDAQQMIDIPVCRVAIDDIPQVPAGYEVENIDVVVKLRRTREKP